MGNICLTSGNRITPNQLIFPAQCRRQVEGFSPKAAAPMTEAAIPKQPWPKHSSESQTWSSSLQRGPPPLLVLLGRHLRHHQERLPLAWAWSSAWPWGAPPLPPLLPFGLGCGLASGSGPPEALRRRFLQANCFRVGGREQRRVRVDHVLFQQLDEQAILQATRARLAMKQIPT